MTYREYATMDRLMQGITPAPVEYIAEELGSEKVKAVCDGVYSDTEVSDVIGADAPPPTKSKKFSPPDVETVKNYFAEKGGTEAQAIQFYSYYESIGWKRGKNPMQKWRAAATGWISRDRDEAKKANAPRNRAFMASRPAEEAENAKNFLADAARRRPLKKQ